MSTSKPAQKPPILRRSGGRFILESQDFPTMQGALAVLLRRALAESVDIDDCAQKCGVSIADLRRVSYLTGVPLLFAVDVGSER